MKFKCFLPAGAMIILLLSTAFGQSPNNTKNDPFFGVIGAGYSFSMKSDIDADPAYWDPAPEGYNSDLGNVPAIEIGLGYNITPWLSTSVSTARRGTYKYEKQQTPSIGTTPDFLGAKTRYFDLDNSNVMFNIILHGTNKLVMHIGKNMLISPFIGGGIGVARNELFNFHSVLFKTDSHGINYVAAIMSPNVHYSLAAEALVGISWSIYKRTKLEFGYRFYYGGEFESNDYVTDVKPGEPGEKNRATLSPSWKGHLLANEAFVNIVYDF